MRATERKRAAVEGRPYLNQPANYTAMKSTCKRGIVLLALWGLITPEAATAILRALGMTHA